MGIRQFLFTRHNCLVTAVNRGGHGDSVVREEGEQHFVNTAERSNATRTENAEKHRGAVSAVA